MLINKELKYILIFSGFAFFSSMLLGLFSEFHFSTMLYRAFLQGIVFFIIGLSIGFIYKKYLKELFIDVETKDSTLNNGFESKNEDYTVELGLEDDNKTEINDTFDATNNNNDFDFLEEVKKYRDHKNDINKSKESKQVEYIEENNPKIVADAIRTLMSKKE